MMPVIEIEEFWAVVLLVILNVMHFGGWVLLALWLLMPGAFRAFRPLDYEPAPEVVLGEYACWAGYHGAPESDPELMRILNVDAGCVSLATEAVQ